MKNKNSLNLFQKLEILIKKYIKKRKIYLETEEGIIDFSTLEVIDKKGSGFVINLKKIFQDKIIKSKNKPIYKYIFKTKDGYYIGGNILSLNLLTHALTDIYKTNAFILENSDNVIFVLGNKYKILKKDENFNKEKEDFFQGINPQVVNIYDAISLLLPIDIKKIFTLIVLVLGIPLLFILINIFNNAINNQNNNEINEIPTLSSIQKPKKKIKKTEEKINFVHSLPKTISNIIATNYFISKIFNNYLTQYDMVFIRRIDFQNREITYYSFMPLDGFRKGQIFYEKTLKLNPSEVEIYDLFFMAHKILNKNPLECEKNLLKIGAKIQYVDDNGVYKIFSLNKTLGPIQATKLISNFFGCKDIITGNVEFDYLKNKVNINLKIKLFYQ